MKILIRVAVIFIFNIQCLLMSQTINNTTERSFYIPKPDNKIRFFKLDIKLSRVEPNTIIRLYERQIFMPMESEDSQAIALLENIHLITSDTQTIDDVGFAVCISPHTSIHPEFLRLNPGVEVILLDIEKNFDNKQDWERAIKHFNNKNKSQISEHLTIYWEIPPKDTSTALLIPIYLNASSLRMANRLVPELISEFIYEPEKSMIRELIAKRFGKQRSRNLFYISLHISPKSTGKTYEYIAVFRVW